MKLFGKCRRKAKYSGVDFSVHINIVFRNKGIRDVVDRQEVRLLLSLTFSSHLILSQIYRSASSESSKFSGRSQGSGWCCIGDVHVRDILGISFDFTGAEQFVKD